MSKTLSVLTLLLVLVVGIGFAGGGQEDGDDPDQPVTISIAHWDIDQSITGKEDPVYDHVTERLGIEIEPVSVSWGDYRDKITVWAASGELPDAFSIDVVGTQIYRNWISNGIVRSLPEDMSPYPNIQSIISAGDYEAYSVDGQNWFLPRANYPDPAWWANDRGVLYRADWMESLGYDEPETLEQFIDLMVAFATEDPDGNGVNDTVGLTAHNSGFLWGAVMEVAPKLVWGGWIEEDGRWVHAGVSDQAFAFYSTIRRLYEAGGLDPDFAVLQAEDGINKFGSGRAGAIALQVAAKHWNKPANVWASLNPNIRFADVTNIMPERVDENGDRWRFITASYWSETYINGGSSDAQAEAVLELYDYLMTDEFKTISLWGFEGVDYQETADGKESLLPLKDDGSPMVPVDKYPFLYSMSYFSTWGDETQYDRITIDEGIREESWDHLMWVLDAAEAPPIAWDLNAHAPNLPSFQRVNIDGNADMVNFVLASKSPEDAWADIVDKYDAQGYQQLEEEMNEYADSIGM